MLDFIRDLFSEGPAPSSIAQDQEMQAGFIYALGLEGEDIHPGLEN